MRNSQPKQFISEMYAPESQKYVYNGQENLVDLRELMPQEELDFFLNNFSEELLANCEYNNPSPAPSFESASSPSLSLSPSETGTFSTYQSQVSSPIESSCDMDLMEFVMQSPSYTTSQSPSDDMGYFESSPSLPSSPIYSPTMPMEPAVTIYTQNNLKQEAEVPTLRGPTKVTKKRIPQNMKACKHIWQFLRDLLMSPEHSTWITWLDAKRGIFKILKPDEIASAWRLYKSQDRRKDFSNEDEDEKDSKKKYPNMARGIRYSRDCGYFEAISKSEMRDFGKKLVYKFSKTTTVHCAWLRSIMTD